MVKASEVPYLCWRLATGSLRGIVERAETCMHACKCSCMHICMLYKFCTLLKHRGGPHACYVASLPKFRPRNDLVVTKDDFIASNGAIDLSLNKRGLLRPPKALSANLALPSSKQISFTFAQKTLYVPQTRSRRTLPCRGTQP